MKIAQSFNEPVCLFCVMNFKPVNNIHKIETASYVNGEHQPPVVGSMDVPCAFPVVEE